MGMEGEGAVSQVKSSCMFSSSETITVSTSIVPSSDPVGSSSSCP